MQARISDAICKAWEDVEDAYRLEKLNSERALQAVIYSSLTSNSNLPRSHFTVLVEPTWAIIANPAHEERALQDLEMANEAMPDLVIIDTSVPTPTVVCLIELKFAPHWWHPRAKILDDLYKLLGYWKSKCTTVRLDLFGPSRIFNPKTRKWMKPQPICKVRDDALLVFADIERSDSETLKNMFFLGEQSLNELTSSDNFLFLRGAIDQLGNGEGKFDVKKGSQLCCPPCTK